MDLFILAQSSDAGSAIGGIIGGVLSLAFAAVMIASMWKVYTKAGEPGWAALVPIYNIIVLLKIVGRPMWWIVLFLIPVVNFIALFIVSIDVAKSFGKGTGYGIGLVVLGPIFYPLLGFGDAQYQGASAG